MLHLRASHSSQHPAPRRSKPRHNLLHRRDPHAAHATLGMMPTPCKTLEKTPERPAATQRGPASCAVLCRAPAWQQPTRRGKPQSPVEEGDGEGRRQGWVLTQLFWHGCATQRWAQGGRCWAGRERAGFGPGAQGARLAGGQRAAETGSAVGSRECLCTPTLGAASSAGMGRVAAGPPCGTGHQHWQSPAIACQDGFEGGPSEPEKREYFFSSPDIQALLCPRAMHQAGCEWHLPDLCSATRWVFHIPALPLSPDLPFCPNKES